MWMTCEEKTLFKRAEWDFCLYITSKFEIPHFGGICLGRNRWVSCIFVVVVLGYIYRNCTEKGWSDFYPSYEEACKIPEDEEIEPEVNIAHSHLEIQDYLLDFFFYWY